MTDHTFVVEADQNHLDRLAKIRPVTDEDRADAWTWHVECSDPAACPGWIECAKDHPGMDPDDEDSPAFDKHDEEVEIHGVMHTWIWGYNWTVPFVGCPVAEDRDHDIPDGIPTPLARPGRYPVETEWDETDCTLMLIEPTPDL